MSFIALSTFTCIMSYVYTKKAGTKIVPAPFVFKSTRQRLVRYGGKFSHYLLPSKLFGGNLDMLQSILVTLNL